MGRLKKGLKMGNIDSIESAEKELKATIESLRAHFEQHKPLLEAVFPILGAWSHQQYNYGVDRDERGRSAGVTYSPSVFSINCVAIDLYLGPDDSITKDVAIFAESHVDPIAERIGLTVVRPDSYVELGWSGLEYKGNGIRLLVRGWFEGSKRCQVIGTGEMEEKKKVICE